MVVWRNGFTYIANIFVLGLSLIFFFTIDSSTTQFRLLGIVCVGLGACTTIYYGMQVKEVSLS